MSDWTSYSIKEWAEYCHGIARSKGWYDDVDEVRVKSVDYVLSRIALIHSEASEAVESVRKGEPYHWLRADGKPEGLGPELADVVIRCMDLAESLGINLEAEIACKCAFNKTRSHRHGAKLA